MLIVVAFKNAELEMPTSPLRLGVTGHVQLGQEALLPVLGAVLVYPPSFNFPPWKGAGAKGIKTEANEAVIRAQMVEDRT